MMLVAVVGGFAKFIFPVFGYIGEYVNMQIITAKFIRALYFIEKPVDERPKEKMLLFRNKFNFLD